LVRKPTTAGAPTIEVQATNAISPAAAGNGANVIVLAKDATLLELLKHSLEGRQRIWRADNALHAADLLVAAQSGVLFIDAALLTHETPALVDRLHDQFPDMPIVVTGRRDDEVELGERISSGVIFRFLHKPASADRVRNFIDAAARRGADRPGNELPAATSVPAAAGRSIGLPRISVDLAVARRTLRIGAALALVSLAVWAVVGLFQAVPWERLSLPGVPAPAADARRDPGPPTDPRAGKFARQLGAAGIALTQGRLVEPEGQNAVELYRSVLLRDPGNVEARQGLERASTELLLRVEQALLAEDLTAAASMLDAARSADPSNPRLDYFSSQLLRERDRQRGAMAAAIAANGAGERAQAEQIGRLLTQAGERMSQGKLVGGADSAETYVLEARGLRPDDPGVQQALNALSGRMLLAGGEALAAGDTARAQDWADRAGTLGVDGTSVARLRAGIESARMGTIQEDRSRLLALANQRIAQGRLVVPTGDSAQHYVDLLRAAAPGHDGLAETSALLASRLLEEAKRLLREGRDAEAETLLALADDAGARSVDISAARSTLSNARARAAAAQEILPESALTKVTHQSAAYPARAASRGVEGSVEVQFTVTVNGSTRDAVVIESNPAGIFDQAVLDAIAVWRYEPRVVAGKPIDQRVQLRVRFELAQD
jgi:TonB family protein